jgi:VanZ family protein
MKQFVRRYPFSILCIALVWYLSILFIPPNGIELPGIHFIDKWTHFVMYGGTCAVIWFEYLRSHVRLDWWRLFYGAWMAPVVMGGVIELVQAFCTTNRSGEWLDFLADGVGVTLAVIIGLMMMPFVKKKPTA